MGTTCALSGLRRGWATGWGNFDRRKGAGDGGAAMAEVTTDPAIKFSESRLRFLVSRVVFVKISVREFGAVLIVSATADS